MQSDRAAALTRFDFAENLPVVAVLGGSQGSRALNALMIDALESLDSAAELQVVWQTGPQDHPELKPLESRFPWVRIFDFIENMGPVYAAADLVVSRAGALALAEITRCGKPAVLVPFPGAAADHQTTNARVLEDARAAIVIQESDLSPPKFVALVVELLSDPEKLKAMQEASRSLSVPDASQRIAKEVLSLAAS